MHCVSVFIAFCITLPNLYKYFDGIIISPSVGHSMHLRRAQAGCVSDPHYLRNLVEKNVSLQKNTPVYILFYYLTYSRWTSSLPFCLWSLRIFPSLPGSRLTIFYRDASSAISQLVNQWLNFTYSRSHAFRYERKDTNSTLVRIELTTSGRYAGYLLY